MSLYAADGSYNVTVVSGSTYTGLHAPDGSYNVVVVDGSAITGLYHKCGAYNVIQYVSGPASYYAPCGAIMVSQTPYVSGTMKVTGLAVATGGISFVSGYPLDSVTGVTITGAYGVGALKSGYSGPLFDLASGTTISTTGPGYPNVTALATALGVDANTGIGGAQISKWYDQNGTNHWVQATAARRPMVYLIKGKVYIGDGGILNGGSLVQSFMTNGASLNNRSASIFASVIPFSSQNAGAVGQNLFSTIIGTGTVGSALGTDMAFMASSALDATGTVQGANVYTGVGDFTAGIQAPINPYLGIQPQVLSFTGSASAISFGANNATGTGTALTAGSGNLILGQASAGFYPYSGRITSVIISSSIFTGPQVTAMKTSLGSWSVTNLNVNKTNALNIAVDGASSDVGQGAVPGNGYGTISGGGYGYVEQLKDDAIFSGVSWHNTAIPGATIANRTSDMTFMMNTVYQAASTKNVFIGPNISAVASIGTGGGAPAGTAAYADFLTYLTGVKTKSWTGIACIIFYDAGDLGRQTFNNLMITNAVANGISIIDMRSQTQLLSPPYANGDGHFTVLGDTLVASFVKPYLQTFL